MAFNIEELSDSKILFLLYGNDHPLTEPFLKTLDDTLTLVFLTKNQGLDSESSFRFSSVILKPEKSKALSNIKESFSHALFFIQEASDKKHLFDLSSKLTHDKTRTLIIIPAREILNFSDVLATFKRNKYVSFAILGDLFGSDIDESYSPVSKIIEDCLQNKKAELNQDSLEMAFPISEKDSLLYMNLLLFGHSLFAKCFLFFYKEVETLTSCVHILRRAEPELEVTFSNQPFNESGIIKREEILREVEDKLGHLPSFVVDSASGFEDAVNVYANFLSRRSFGSIRKSFFQKIRLPKKSELYRYFVPACATIGVILFLHFIVFFSMIFFFQRSIKYLEEFEVDRFSNSIKITSIMHRLVDPQMKLLSLVIPELFFEDYYLLDEAITLFSDFESRFVNLLDLEKERFSQAQVLEILSFTNRLHFFYEKAHLSNSKLFRREEDFSRFLSAAQTLPSLLGYNGKKHYLLLFQNNGELRPTGGFIGSIGELTVENGGVSQFSIRDTYEIDGQLKAHVEPHYVIRRYLQPHLYLRDSNFSLDFEKSASMSALLYKLSTGRAIDGIIALDYEVLRQIIYATGPIEINSQKLDGNELFDYLQSSIDSSFFPGSSKKRDLLGSVYTKLFLKFTEDRKAFLKAVAILPRLISEKHILFAFNEKAIQQGFSINGFSSTLTDLRTLGASSVNDFLALNEANIGVNKANTGISRTLEYDVFLDNSQIKSKVTLGLFNSNYKKEGYKVYIRIATPLGSRLESIIIDGKSQELEPAVIDFYEYEKKDFKAPRALEVDQFTEENRAVFGFISEVGPDDTSEIIISYINGLKVPPGTLVTYSFLASKQPGTLDYPLTVRVHYDPIFLPEIENNVKVNDGAVELKNIISSDFRTDLRLSRR